MSSYKSWKIRVICGWSSSSSSCNSCFINSKVVEDYWTLFFEITLIATFFSAVLSSARYTLPKAPVPISWMILYSFLMLKIFLNPRVSFYENLSFGIILLSTFKPNVVFFSKCKKSGSESRSLDGLLFICVEVSRALGVIN